MKIDELKPGRKLDALVAEKVMNKDVVWLDLKNEDGVQPHWNVQVLDAVPTDGSCFVAWDANGTEILYTGQMVPKFSVEISSAWKIIDYFDNDTRDIHVSPSREMGRWYCYIEDNTQGSWNTDSSWNRQLSFESGESAPHAICLAALAALVGEEE